MGITLHIASYIFQIDNNDAAMGLVHLAKLQVA